jgi:hypothetical protein
MVLRYSIVLLTIKHAKTEREGQTCRFDAFNPNGAPRNF